MAVWLPAFRSAEAVCMGDMCLNEAGTMGMIVRVLPESVKHFHFNCRSTGETGFAANIAEMNTICTERGLFFEEVRLFFTGFCEVADLPGLLDDGGEIAEFRLPSDQNNAF
uniref:Uncharacterized protein n=1 Tax=Panagrolaimus sp. JU765 TaxID=591449 RepID=A0AC34RME7_9BILA